MYKLSLKILIKMLHKKVLDRSFQILNNPFFFFLALTLQIKLAFDHLWQSCNIHACYSLFNICVPPLMIRTPSTLFRDFLKPHTTGQALCNGCWPQAVSLYVWPNLRIKCRASWVRRANWGLGMSYVVYAVYQSVHLVYTALSESWFMKEKLSSTIRQMAHFMGHKTEGEMEVAWITMSDKPNGQMLSLW